MNGQEGAQLTVRQATLVSEQGYKIVPGQTRYEIYPGVYVVLKDATVALQRHVQEIDNDPSAIFAQAKAIATVVEGEFDFDEPPGDCVTGVITRAFHDWVFTARGQFRRL